MIGSFTVYQYAIGQAHEKMYLMEKNWIYLKFMKNHGLDNKCSHNKRKELILQIKTYKKHVIFISKIYATDNKRLIALIFEFRILYYPLD